MSFKRLGDDVLFDKQRLRIASLDSVSRDVVRILEGHYSTLVAALGHQMTRTIPVVILQDAEYRVSTGAPAWAGGQFDNDDGTITIPLNLFYQIEFVNPEEQRNWEAWKDLWLERVLIHETAHAFIEDLSHGVAPRELHEGLAMYFEREVTKNRTDRAVSLQEDVQQEARARYPGDQAAQHAHEERCLAQIFNEIRTAGIVHAGTLNSVYVGGQMFVEYLVRQRSMGGVQDLLKAMAETRSADGGFDRVYGNGSDGTRRAWLDWLRLQWGVGNARRGG